MPLVAEGASAVMWQPSKWGNRLKARISCYYTVEIGGVMISLLDYWCIKGRRDFGLDALVGLS
jgi:hypothetical protein